MTPSGPIGKLFAVLGGAILLVAGFMFSLVLLAFIMVAGLVAFIYFWWKTRAVRKAMRESPPGGQVIEGEAIVVEDYEEEASPEGTVPSEDATTKRIT